MKRMLILSGKGGTGKTTTAAAFVHFSHACAVADCDVDAPNLHLVNPPSTQPERNIFYGGDKASVDPAKCVGCGKCVAACRFDALRLSQGKCLVDEYSCEGCGVCAYVCPEQAVALHPDAAGIRELYRGEQVFSTAALKMGRGNSGKLVSEVKLAMLKHAPKESLAIIDGSPGIGCPVIASISGVDLVVVVAEPSLSGISDLKRLVRTAATLQTRLAVCVNKWDTDPQLHRADRGLLPGAAASLPRSDPLRSGGGRRGERRLFGGAGGLPRRPGAGTNLPIRKQSACRIQYMKRSLIS